jgi:hypothetical protein
VRVPNRAGSRCGRSRWARRAGLPPLFLVATTFWAPSADEKLGRAQFATQLEPIEQQLETGIRTDNPATVEQARAALKAAIDGQPHASGLISTSAKYTSLALGALSALIALGVAVKHAKSTP